jgi:hypothetical protein
MLQLEKNQKRLIYLALLSAIGYLVASQYEISQNANSPNVSKDDLQKINQIALINSAITFFQVASIIENLENLKKIISDLYNVDYIRIFFHILASFTAILTANNFANKLQCISSQARSSNGSDNFETTLFPLNYNMGFIAIGTMLRGLITVDDDKGRRLINIKKDNLSGVMPALIFTTSCFSTIELDSIKTLFGYEEKKCTGIPGDAEQYMLNIAVIVISTMSSYMLRYLTSQKSPKKVESAMEDRMAGNSSGEENNVGDGQNFANGAGCDRADVENTAAADDDEIEVDNGGDKSSIGSKGSDNIVKKEDTTKSTEPDANLGGKRYDAAIFLPALVAGSVPLCFLGNNGFRLAITSAAVASAMSAGLISVVGVASRNCTKSDYTESSWTELSKRGSKRGEEGPGGQDQEQSYDDRSTSPPVDRELVMLPTEPSPAPAPTASQVCKESDQSQILE